MNLSDEELSCDEILRGKLKLWQPKKGYRFSVDPLLLLHFLDGERVERACDLGTGCGVVALGLLRLERAARVAAVEVQPRLAALARQNAVENALADRVEVHELDLADEAAMRAGLPGASFELVASNPPYRPLGEGSTNPVDEAAIARHEVKLTLADVVRQARRLLAPGGRAALVYPAERLTSLLSLLDEAGLRPLRLRLVHGRAHEPANRVLVEAKKGAKGNLVVEPPLVLYDEAGYTDEARRALGER